MTEELAWRLERVAVDFMVGWLEGASRLPQSEQRVVRFGSAVAAANPANRDLDFVNRVHALAPDDAERVEEICGFYRALGIRPWFELLPGSGFDRLAARLTEAGASQIGFHTVLYGVAEKRPPRDSAVAVRRIGPDELDVFSAVLLAGHEVPERARAEAARTHAHWPAMEGWRLYVASIDETPVAAAVLTLGDGIGYLANAATVPHARCRGAQTALIRRRLADAADAGCSLVTSGAAFASVSQHNLERAGLRIAYMKAVWRSHRL